jgi:hypothetical protein
VKSVQSLPKKRPASGLPGAGLVLNAKARLGGRAFSFSYYFYFIELRETKMPSLVDLFLACKGFGLFGFANLIFGFGGFGGLTCDFWAEMTKKMQREKIKAMMEATAKAKQRQIPFGGQREEKQIPCGDDNKKSKSNSKGGGVMAG